ncbi:MAG TPA: glycerol-3-phosphate 1-O-acyltransferase PlsY [Thermodesulfovibrionales bacterium]|nr:glycerol-3-phosphate 1-O-acyltransferase PlsY [Thermodesulfovibrionales bacterium]
MRLFLIIIGAILLGSIPFGVVVARVRGVDLKKVGSGNIGATNVLRTMGKTPALITLAGDVLKGAIPVLAAKYLLDDLTFEGIVGLCAVLGHNFSLFLRFRGGKGVATSIGVLLVYSPLAAVVTILIWVAVIVITRYSSMGALVSFGLLPLSLYLVDYTKEKMIVSFMITALLMIRHVDNIHRLIRGKEPKIGERT